MSRRWKAPDPAELAPPTDPTMERAIAWLDRSTSHIERIMGAMPGMSLDALAGAYCTVMTIHWGLKTLVESVPQGQYGNEFSDKAAKLQGLIMKAVKAIHNRMIEVAVREFEKILDSLEVAIDRFGFDPNKIPPFLPEPPVLDPV